MPSQQLIYSLAIANAAGDGPWIDVSGADGSSDWTVHIKNFTSGTTVEVSNEIPTPYSYNLVSNVKIPSYPPYPSPRTITQVVRESHTIANTVTVTTSIPAGSSFLDQGVVFLSGPQAGVGLQFSPTIAGAAGQYTVNAATGVYSFYKTDVSNGFNIGLSYEVTAPSAGVVLPASTGYFVPVSPTSGDVLVVAKNDLNVKWVRVRVSGGAGTVLAFLHTNK